MRALEDRRRTKSQKTLPWLILGLSHSKAPWSSSQLNSKRCVTMPSLISCAAAGPNLTSHASWPNCAACSACSDFWQNCCRAACQHFENRCSWRKVGDLLFKDTKLWQNLCRIAKKEECSRLANTLPPRGNQQTTRTRFEKLQDHKHGWSVLSDIACSWKPIAGKRPSTCTPDRRRHKIQ